MKLGAPLAVVLLSSHAHGAFVGYVQTVTQVTTGGVLLDQCQVFARFNGPTDTVLNAFNLAALGGATVADPHGAFYHKDNASYNSGVLSREFGTWRPSNTGSASLNRPFDSFLTIGGTATPVNTSVCDPSWASGGQGAHAADARGDNRPDLLNNGSIGWFNSNPPNLMGRVGIAPNTATDVLLAQFVIDRNAFIGTWSLTIGYNDGVPGSAVQFGTSTFVVGVPAPGAGALLGLALLTRGRGRRRVG